MMTVANMMEQNVQLQLPAMQGITSIQVHAHHVQMEHIKIKKVKLAAKHVQKGKK
jgi:hypothetical protein